MTLYKMNKYNNTNNFNRSQAGDSPLRFNKRPRYGMNNNGGNSSPRFKHQNQSGYQYTSNRNRPAENYQCNQYEERSNRHYYGNNQIRSNHHQQQQNNQSSPYSHKSAISPISPSSTSSFTTTAINQNVIKFSSTQPNLLANHTAAESIIATNNQQQHQQSLTPNVIDSSNYYGFAYNNFYPTSYNADLTATVPSNPFGVADGIPPFMWQTITSRLPPKLPQNQPPPPILPPLPSTENFPPLPPPPPMPESITESPSVTTSATEVANNKFHGQDSGTKTIIKMKAKRKAMSMRYKISKSWTEKDVALALKAEELNTKKLKDIILIIRFPDPEISREIVKCYSPDIESVHFQLNFAPRYCLVHLKPGADVEKTIDHLSKIPFGTGFLSVEVKQIPHKTHTTKPNEVDPFTLYVGNLPTTIACKTLKEHFPGAARIDIGFAQRMKYTRYAFIRYQTVEQAIEAYKRMLDAEIGGRTLTIRFRRLVASNEGNKDGEAENHEDVTSELFSQADAAATEDGTSILSGSENADPIAGLENKSNDDVVEPNSNDLPNEKNSTEMEKNTDNNSDRENVFIENNLKATSDSISEINSTKSATNFTEKSNIKQDPDIDPNDVVVRDKTITSHFKVNNSNIKQEEENIFLHMEFFEKPNNQTNCSDKSIGSDRVSVSSTIDEMDTMSTLSTNSLGEFLQTCQRAQIQANNFEDKGPPLAKRNKFTDAIFPARIKREPLENKNIAAKRNLPLCPQENVYPVKPIKQEAVENSDEHLNTINNKHTNLHTVQIIPESRETVPAHPCNKSTNNEDEVPSTALFFQSAYQNMLTNSSNDCDYDEFYETRTSISSQESASLANIKTEPSSISTRSIIRRNTNEKRNNNQTHQIILNRPSVTSEKKSNINTTTTSKTFDDDDNLVPPQNLLGSYRPAPNVIKEETEHDDIFSVPFNKTNRLNEDISPGDISYNYNNNNDQSNNNKNTRTSEVSKTNVPEDNDDDVVIISDNIRREIRETRPNSLVLTNLFLPKQTDLISLEHKSFPVSIPNYNLSKLIHRDDLDRLYDQLDADSDSEL